MSKTATNLEQLRDLPDEELQQRLAATRDELFRLHLGQHTNQVTSTAQLKTKRRDIARIMTIMRGRKLGHEVQAQKRAEAPAETTEATETKATKKAKKAKS
ncbi:MAG TPA: 50S ribosomal protein L29 [Kofleriaceae bacterium]|nr:50S ribosomal protein L29 [Kofleriaceae bacterium]